MIKINAPYISQKDRYPTGCESVSAVMLLKFLGYDISVDEFISKYLDCQAFSTHDGQLYGPDPRRRFCGSPYNENDFGCYAPVICKALTKVFQTQSRTGCTKNRLNQENQGMQNNNTPRINTEVSFEVIDETGTPIENLLKCYINKGIPVIFWACIDMKEPIIGPSWKLHDTGETFTWISNEHCMLLVGYDDEGYYFNDPYEEHGVVRYPKEIVEDRHKAQYEMAVSVRGI